MARIVSDRSGNLEPLLDLYPDHPAVDVQHRGGARTRPADLGHADAAAVPQGARCTRPGVTNIRNVASPHWRRGLGIRYRCVVPATTFSKYGQQPDPVTKRKPLVWFALDGTQPLFFFAGIWTP